MQNSRSGGGLHTWQLCFRLYEHVELPLGRRCGSATESLGVEMLVLVHPDVPDYTHCALPIPYG